MPVLAPIAAAATAAVGAVTVEGLMIGASVVGSGMSVIGAATGNKTLQKIGAGMGFAGSLGSAARFMSKGAGRSTMASKLLDSGGDMESALAQPLKGNKTADGLSKFNAPSGKLSSMDNFNKGANSIGAGADSIGVKAGGFDPEVEKSFLQRANDTLTKYNPMMNALGGMGEAYMMNERMNLERDLQNQRIGFDQQVFDRSKTNTSTPLGINSAQGPALTRNTEAYLPLLQRR